MSAIYWAKSLNAMIWSSSGLLFLMYVSIPGKVDKILVESLRCFLKQRTKSSDSRWVIFLRIYLALGLVHQYLKCIDAELMSQFFLYRLLYALQTSQNQKLSMFIRLHCSTRCPAMKLWVRFFGSNPVCWARTRFKPENSVIRGQIQWWRLM